MYFFTGHWPLPIVIPLSKKSARGKGNTPCLASLPFGSGIGRKVDADDANTSGRIHDAHAILNDLYGLFLSGMTVIVRLISDRVDSAVRAFHLFFARTQARLNAFVVLAQLEDPIDGIAIRKVDWRGAEFAGFRQALGNRVD